MSAGATGETVGAVTEGEALRTREPAEQGHLLRLWTLRSPSHGLGLWRADDTEALRGLLATLPMPAWTSVHTARPSPHHSDPDHPAG
ncbi:MAG: muconolactone Delta-isomerase family protein [Pseudonocardiales bacterium]